jgi:hypothetical protein
VTPYPAARQSPAGIGGPGPRPLDVLISACHRSGEGNRKWTYAAVRSTSAFSSRGTVRAGPSTYKMRRYFDVGVSHFVFATGHPLDPAPLRLLIEDVLPTFG